MLNLGKYCPVQDNYYFYSLHMNSILAALELINLVVIPYFLYQCMKYNTGSNAQLMMLCMGTTTGLNDLQLALR